mmetsp:Transcript_13489/g.47559  ORF Transcript_13489/g.47559 Transcript_13489/m.47559 type:complete len:120 (-) Transcript_13489:64-423(-)
MAEEMLEIMNIEGISGPRTVAQVCNDGFELSLLIGDDSESQYWAHLSYEAHRLGWGEDYPMTPLMRQYAQQPPKLQGSRPTTASTVTGRQRQAKRRDVKEAETKQVLEQGCDFALTALD